MFLSCGDSLYDMFLEPDTTDSLRVNVNGVTGGSPMNVALGLNPMALLNTASILKAPRICPSLRMSSRIHYRMPSTPFTSVPTPPQ